MVRLIEVILRKIQTLEFETHFVNLSPSEVLKRCKDFGQDSQRDRDRLIFGYVVQTTLNKL
jgi:hypothetical protein